MLSLALPSSFGSPRELDAFASAPMPSTPPGAARETPPPPSTTSAPSSSIRTVAPSGRRSAADIAEEDAPAAAAPVDCCLFLRRLVAPGTDAGLPALGMLAAVAGLSTPPASMSAADAATVAVRTRIRSSPAAAAAASLPLPSECVPSPTLCSGLSGLTDEGPAAPLRLPLLPPEEEDFLPFLVVAAAARAALAPLRLLAMEGLPLLVELFLPRPPSEAPDEADGDAARDRSTVADSATLRLECRKKGVAGIGANALATAGLLMEGAAVPVSADAAAKTRAVVARCLLPRRRQAQLDDKSVMAALLTLNLFSECHKSCFPSYSDEMGHGTLKARRLSKRFHSLRLQLGEVRFLARGSCLQSTSIERRQYAVAEVVATINIARTSRQITTQMINLATNRAAFPMLCGKSPLNNQFWPQGSHSYYLRINLATEQLSSLNVCLLQPPQLPPPRPSSRF
mmetsp:Transcript_25512/g.75158  ORF Transcript_25512/g.75158 Transcript_25512/m.75158 type:complete len:455 (-) Transcript_25512:289-1653(-)